MDADVIALSPETLMATNRFMEQESVAAPVGEQNFVGDPTKERQRCGDKARLCVLGNIVCSSSSIQSSRRTPQNKEAFLSKTGREEIHV
ncbi:hypothetical protein ACS0TY_026941 [Phlomoides rotata]